MFPIIYLQSLFPYNFSNQNLSSDLDLKCIRIYFEL